jgi:hypothetical protein
MNKQTYKLYRGNDLLGTIIHTKIDMPWHWGTFEPTEHFDAVKPLFEQEIQLLDTLDSNSQKWHENWAQITKPGLRLVSEQDNQQITDLLIHIDGSEVWWRC